jgi:hypothetical protein
MKKLKAILNLCIFGPLNGYNLSDDCLKIPDRKFNYKKSKGV